MPHIEIQQGIRTHAGENPWREQIGVYRPNLSISVLEQTYQVSGIALSCDELLELASYVCILSNPINLGVDHRLFLCCRKLIVWNLVNKGKVDF